jgi:hypothetical protein
MSPFSKAFLTVFLVLAILPAPVSSASVESVPNRAPIVVRVLGEIAGGSAVATPTHTSGTTQVPRTVHSELDESGATTLSLAPGHWRFEIEAAGYWSERRALEVEKATEEGEVLELRVLPAAKVAGKLGLPRGETAPDELRAEFRLPAQRAAELGMEKGSSTCSVAEGLGFECVLPAGMMDIGLRAPSFVTAWLWDRTLRRGSTTEVGTIELRRGSSVSGWIEVAEGPGDPRDALLRLEASGLLGAGSRAEEQDRELLMLEARANQRGHFAFEAVPPGSYGLTVELEGYATVQKSGIPVLLDAQSMIGEPLELFRSRKLRVTVEPPVDPTGGAWNLDLRPSDDPGAESLETAVREGAAALDSVIPGRYSALLTDGQGIRRWWDEIEIEPGQEELAILVESFPVRGRVLFGREPLPAELIFGGVSGAVRIPVQADEDGDFAVELPRGGTWRVDVDHGPVRGTKWVDVPRKRSQNGSARVEIVFPANGVAGRVVDTQGAAVGGAEVLLFAGGDLRGELTAADGSFAFSGVEPGEAVVAARLEPDLGSEEARVSVRPSGSVEVPELVLVDRVRLSGMVESSSGGVPGAMVLALSQGPAGLRVMPSQAFSGRDGFFELSVPQAVSELRIAVLAPGFPLQVLEVPADPRIPVMLPVGGEGGELVLKPGLSDASRTPGSVLVFHRGFPLDVSILSQWARRHGSIPSDSEMRVPRLSAGVYHVCTGIKPQEFLKAFSSGRSAEGCRRVRLWESDSTIVDLREDDE